METENLVPFSTYWTVFPFKFSKNFSLSRVCTNGNERHAKGGFIFEFSKFFEQTSQLTGHVDKRGCRIAVPGLVVSQTSEVRLGLQINRLDGKGGVVFIGKSVKPSQPFEPGHLRPSRVEHEAGDGQRPFLYYLLGLVRDRSWPRFVCYVRETRCSLLLRENFKLNFYLESCHAFSIFDESIEESFWFCVERFVRFLKVFFFFLTKMN